MKRYLRGMRDRRKFPQRIPRWTINSLTTEEREREKERKENNKRTKEIKAIWKINQKYRTVPWIKQTECYVKGENIGGYFYKLDKGTSGGGGHRFSALNLRSATAQLFCGSFVTHPSSLFTITYFSLPFFPRKNRVVNAIKMGKRRHAWPR